jgi:hypothetical protein
MPTSNTSNAGYIPIIPKNLKTFKFLQSNTNVHIEEIVTSSVEVDSKKSIQYVNSASLNMMKTEDDLKKMKDTITCRFTISDLPMTHTIEMTGVSDEILIHHMVEHIELMNHYF